MLNNIKDAKKAIFNKSNRLAIIVGNGINRYAYGNLIDTSWSNLLLECWRKNLPITLSKIDNGITFTEFYDIMEFQGESSSIRNSVVDIVNSWSPQPYHAQFREFFQGRNIPVLTTNFDKNLEGADLVRVNLNHPDVKYGFTDYYPWNVVYTADPKFDNGNIFDFGIWHINGVVDYSRSLKLSISQYTNQAKRAVEFIHSAKGEIDDFKLKDKNMWRGYNTWLHLIFNCDLCIMGLGLDEQETFLRWLLIQREKYFRKFPARRHLGWYIGTKGDLPEGKKFYLEKLGFEIVCLKNYREIYDKLIQ